jgi:hypothetical protein
MSTHQAEKEERIRAFQQELLAMAAASAPMFEQCSRLHMAYFGMLLIETALPNLDQESQAAVVVGLAEIAHNASN